MKRSTKQVILCVIVCILGILIPAHFSPSYGQTRPVHVRVNNINLDEVTVEISQIVSTDSTQLDTVLRHSNLVQSGITDYTFDHTFSGSGWGVFLGRPVIIEDSTRYEGNWTQEFPLRYQLEIRDLIMEMWVE